MSAEGDFWTSMQRVVETTSRILHPSTLFLPQKGHIPPRKYTPRWMKGLRGFNDEVNYAKPLNYRTLKKKVNKCLGPDKQDTVQADRPGSNSTV